MNRVPSFILCVAIAAMILFPGVSRLHAQEQTPSPTPAAQTPSPTPAAQQPDDEEERNPFAPEPAPVLQPGMKGSDTNDPRAKAFPGHV